MQLPITPSRRFTLTLPIVSVMLVIAGCESLQSGTGAQDVDEVIIPELRGVVQQSDQAAAGIRLRVSHREGERSVCEIPLAETRADEDGKFLFPVVRADISTATLDSLSNNWQICVASDDLAGQTAGSGSDTEWQQIWYDSHAGVMFGEKFTELSCNLDKLPVDEARKKSFFSRLKQPPVICVAKAAY